MLVEDGALRRHRKELAALDSTAKKALRAEMRGIGKDVADTARSNASWSTRIPGAIYVRSRLTGKRPGVSIRVSSAKAPHGRAYEGITGRGAFRHPVYGGDTLVPQSTRPFLAKAARARLPEAKRRLADAVITAIKKEQS